MYTDKDFKLDFNTIKKVIVSPWLPKPVLQSVKDAIQSIDKCGSFRVHRTTLVDNDQWKHAAVAMI